jgi:hypothetical protein
VSCFTVTFTLSEKDSLTRTVSDVDDSLCTSSSPNSEKAFSENSLASPSFQVRSAARRRMTSLSRVPSLNQVCRPPPPASSASFRRSEKGNRLP